MEATPHLVGTIARDPDLRTLTFDYLVEPTLLLDPDTDEIIDANPAACTLLGYDRALLRETRISARPSCGSIDPVYSSRSFWLVAWRGVSALVQ